MDIIYIKAVEDITKLLTNYRYDDSIKRYRSYYLYRGLSDSSYSLQTSLQRNCKGKKKEIETSLLRNFVKYALAENERLADSKWYQLSIGQHHGLPTRMLDWTYSPLMALHFSVSEQSFKDFPEHDSVVWGIEIEEMNSLLPQRYKDKLNQEKAFFFTIDMLNEVTKTLEDYDKDMSNIKDPVSGKTHSAMVLLEPPSIDQRIINQYSDFSIIPDCMDNIEEFLEQNTKKTKKFIIDKSVRWEIRDLLDTLNINERIVYPGLDGLAAWLKRHYYVIDK